MAVQFKRSLLVCMVVTVLGMMIIMGLVFAMPSREYTGKKLCLPNSSEDGGGDLKCGPSEERLAEYLNELLERNYNERKVEKENTLSLKANFAEHGRKPSARFTGKKMNMSLTEKTDKDGMCIVKCWNSGSDVFNNGGYQRYGVEYRDGRLIVPLAGTYHIYSFLDLEKRLDEGYIPGPTSPIKHGIYKYTLGDNRDSEIVTFTQLVQKTDRPFNMYGSFISTISYLNAGDELMVKVSNTSLLQYKRFNTFGVLLV